MIKIFVYVLFLFLFSGCAGFNPNPGERTTDQALLAGDFDRAFKIIEEKAKEGAPWAQLRLGICYVNGWGTEKNIEKAEFWYKKAMEQKASGDWANGKLVGAVGKAGYFNQNSDARIAEFNLAQLYYENEGELSIAYEHVNNVIDESEGKSVFFCCEFAGGRYFTQKQFRDLRDKIRTKMGE